MTETSIEWTDATWNPVTGCTKVSPGCAHCYAEGVADRFWATQYPNVPTGAAPGSIFEGTTRPRRFTDVQCHEDRLDQPLRWRKPRRVFVNSMSDLFHEDIDPLFIGRVFNVMGQAKTHTFQVLTKRHERMKQVVTAYYDTLGVEPYPNVWLGVSVENQATADERIPLLRQVPAAVRFLSVEPLLEQTDIVLSPGCEVSIEAGPHRGIHWVIVGGESGPKSRPCEVSWIRSIRDQCRAANVPVFVKQLGRFPRDEDLGIVYRFADRKGGDSSEWPEDLRVREFPEVPA